jgi:hypothetical protein
MACSLLSRAVSDTGVTVAAIRRPCGVNKERRCDAPVVDCCKPSVFGIVAWSVVPGWFSEYLLGNGQRSVAGSTENKLRLRGRLESNWIQFRGAPPLQFKDVAVVDGGGAVALVVSFSGGLPVVAPSFFGDLQSADL